MFGIVEQDYKLPRDIIEQIGIDVFDYETLDIDTFKPETIEFETFSYETFAPESIDIKFLRRGVIGITKVGYQL